jgi:hypothetical protein
MSWQAWIKTPLAGRERDEDLPGHARKRWGSSEA